MGVGQRHSAMTVGEERRVRTVDPDLDAEQEVDLGRYGRTVAERWWLPVLGLLAGAVAGYLLSLGGGSFYRAQALVYLGQPVGILGGGQVPTLNTPTSARAIVTSESVVRQVARDVGLRPAELRRNVGVNPVASNLPRAAQTYLVHINVQGNRPARVRAAANEFATILVGRLSDYANTRRRALSAQAAANRAALESLNAAVEAPRLSFEAKLLLQLRIAQVQDDITETTQLLTQLRDVEAPRIVTRAAAEETSARSPRNSIVVGALIGLILGTIAALLWTPVVERYRARA